MATANLANMSVLSLPTELIIHVFEEFFSVCGKGVLKALPAPNNNISWRGAPSIAPLLTCRHFHRLGVKLYRAKFVELDISELGEEELCKWLLASLTGPRKWICSAIERFTWSIYVAVDQVPVADLGFENLPQIRLVVPSGFELRDVRPSADGVMAIEDIMQQSVVKDDKIPEAYAMLWIKCVGFGQREDCRGRVTWRGSLVDPMLGSSDKARVAEIEYDVIGRGDKMQVSLQSASIRTERHSETELYRERFYDVVHAIKQLRGQTERRDLPSLHARETRVKFNDCSRRCGDWRLFPRDCLGGKDDLL